MKLCVKLFKSCLPGVHCTHDQNVKVTLKNTQQEAVSLAVCCVLILDTLRRTSPWQDYLAEQKLPAGFPKYPSCSFLNPTIRQERWFRILQNYSQAFFSSFLCIYSIVHVRIKHSKHLLWVCDEKQSNVDTLTHPQTTQKPTRLLSALLDWRHTTCFGRNY